MCPNLTFPTVYELMPDIVGMGDVVEYFIIAWVPAVVQLHTGSWQHSLQICTLSWKSFIYLRYDFPTALQHASCVTSATVTLLYNTSDALIRM